MNMSYSIYLFCLINCLNKHRHQFISLSLTIALTPNSILFLT